MDAQNWVAHTETANDDAGPPASGESPSASDDSKEAEQRRARRHATMAQIGMMHVGSSKDFCRIRNISETGFMAHVYRQMTIGDEVRVETKSGQSLQGIVVWTAEHVPDLASRVVRHIGVQFPEPVDVEPIVSSQFTTREGALQRWPRLSIECHLRLVLDCGRQYGGSLCDISQGGAKFQTSHPLGGETQGLLVIRGLPTLHASVRWISGTRIGVSFEKAIALEMLVDWIQDRREEALARQRAPASSS